jgi:GNAT superfamily N-acetyltransferase
MPAHRPRSRSQPQIVTRRANARDLETVIADVQAGFDSYVSFAPAGWRPPAMASERERTLELLEHPDTWGLIALADDRPLGHVAFFPGRERADEGEGADWSQRPLVPGLAHLWQLFVQPEWWGRGVAPLLHDAALAEMRLRGYGRARLFTPSSHARARRFYERRGWLPAGEEWNDGLALLLTEYLIELRP